MNNRIDKKRALELHNKGLSNKIISQRLGVKMEQVRRAVDPKYAFSRSRKGRALKAATRKQKEDGLQGSPN